MLADFQPRCIMIFMALSSKNPVSHPYCRAPCVVSVASLRQRWCWLRRPQSKKNHLGFEQLDFLYPSSFGTPNMTDGAADFPGRQRERYAWQTRPR
jgi:hypothetical protein